MAKVLTFSRTFPAYHPRKDQPTHFIQKFWASIKVPIPCSIHADKLEKEMHLLMKLDFSPKHHTIRAGNRFKAGDYFSPRVWSGKPYNSKQIIIADDTRVVKTFEFESRFDEMLINGKPILGTGALETLAKNDGLKWEDLLLWFPKPFKGQIICWNESVNY